MNVASKLSMIFFPILLPFFMVSQESNIEWGDSQRQQGRLIKILSYKSDDFYTLRWVGGNVGGSYQLTHNVDFKTVDRRRIKLIVNKSIANYEDVAIVGDDLVVFLSDKKNGKNQLFMQKYGIDLKPSGEQILLASYDLQLGVKGEYKIIFSPNKKYFGVIWEIPGKKDRRFKYGFNIFDTNLNKINDGEYPIRYKSKYINIHDHYISDNADYFLTFSLFKDSEKTIIKNIKEFKEMHVYHIDTSGLQDLLINFSGRKLKTSIISSNNNDFVITGIYSLDNSNSASGIFYKRINLSNGNLTVDSYMDFDLDFIKRGISERDLKKLERRILKGRGNNQLQNFDMRETKLLEDGSIVGVMEQYYVELRTSGDFNNIGGARSSDRYYYYYNDLIVFRISNNGELIWKEKIKKNQVSINDRGRYSSYASYITDSTYNFLFNDNYLNYNEDRTFKFDSILNTLDYGRKKGVVALTNLDLDSGEIQREVFFDWNKIGGISVPKKFKVSYDLNKMIIYTIWGRNERIGSLDF